VLDGTTRRWHARVVVNAAGPWADEVRRRLGGARRRAASPLVRPSRGSHLVFPGRGQREGVLLLARADGRPLFLIPTGEHLLLGTTEIAGAGDPGADLPGADEVSYLVREAGRALPGAGLEPGRALGVMTGVRPLAHDGGRSLGAVPREHRITVEGNVVNVVGGKYTTFRPMCAQALREVLRVLGRGGLRLPSDDSPLPGGDIPDFEHYLKSETQRLERVYPEAAGELARLVRAHGTLAGQVLDRAPGEARPLAPGQPILAAEVRFAVEVERARRLDDVMRRRTALWLAPDFGRRAAAPVAERMAQLLGWDEARTREELAAWWRFAAGEERLLRIVASEGGP
jgi:glycerol-3-phosphate dehydrogenase